MVYRQSRFSAQPDYVATTISSGRLRPRSALSAHGVSKRPPRTGASQNALQVAIRYLLYRSRDAFKLSMRSFKVLVHLVDPAHDPEQEKRDRYNSHGKQIVYQL